MNCEMRDWNCNDLNKQGQIIGLNCDTCPFAALLWLDAEKAEKLKTATLASEEGECQLEQWGQCCCTCVYLLVDQWHCDTMPEEIKAKAKAEGHCGCFVPKGYICTVPEIYEGRGGSSGFNHHGICECHMTEEDRNKWFSEKQFQQAEKDTRIAELTEALKFYADKQNWKRREGGHMRDGHPDAVKACVEWLEPICYSDRGHKARKALKRGE